MLLLNTTVSNSGSEASLAYPRLGRLNRSSIVLSSEKWLKVSAASAEPGLT